MPASGFQDKLLARLDKLDPEQIQTFIRRLSAQRQFLLDILEHLDEGVIVADAGLNLTFLNAKARRMLGWSLNRNPVGENLEDLIGSEHPLEDVLHSLRGRPRRIDGYEYPYGRDSQRTLSLSALPMRARVLPRADIDAEADADGETMLILLLQDVTERKKREDEESRARRLASMATLTAGIAHEVKNPLNSLNIHAQLLRGELKRAQESGRGLDPAKIARAADVLSEETERLGRLVAEFLHAARPRAAQLEPRHVGPLVERTGQLFRGECEQKGITLSVQVSAELPPLMIDEHQLMQALRNLMRNAIDALEDRSREAAESHEAYLPRLIMSAELKSESVHIYVEDNGPGISDEHLEQIMEPYFTTKFGGTGLGLMVVYRVVTEHGGMLHVDSHVGAGTRFTIALPLHLRPVRLLDAAPGEPVRTPSPLSAGGDS